MPRTTHNVKDILKPESNIKNRFIPDYKELEKIVENLRKSGYRIVLTQGVYDLIHEGHARYLEAAKAQGDILIVGVDSDALARKRKGPNRPIVPHKERLNMLSHLRSVDILTLREVHHGINEVIEVVKPDVFIVSQTTKDFAKKRLQECKKYCGKIITLPPQAESTTTGRIRTLTIEGAKNLAMEINKLTLEFLDKIKNA